MKANLLLHYLACSLYFLVSRVLRLFPFVFCPPLLPLFLSRSPLRCLVLRVSFLTDSPHSYFNQLLFLIFLSSSPPPPSSPVLFLFSQSLHLSLPLSTHLMVCRPPGGPRCHFGPLLLNLITHGIVFNASPPHPHTHTKI